MCTLSVALASRTILERKVLEHQCFRCSKDFQDQFNVLGNFPAFLGFHLPRKWNAIMAEVLQRNHNLFRIRPILNGKISTSYRHQVRSWKKRQHKKTKIIFILHNYAAFHRRSFHPALQCSAPLAPPIGGWIRE